MFPDLWSWAVHTIPVLLSFGSHRAVAGGRSRCLAVGCHRALQALAYFLSFIPLPSKGRRETPRVCGPQGSCAFFFVNIESWSLPRSHPKMWQHLPMLAPHHSLLAKGTVVFFFFFNVFFFKPNVGAGGEGGKDRMGQEWDKKNTLKMIKLEAWGSRTPKPGAAPTMCSGRAAAFKAPGTHTDSPSAAKAAPPQLFKCPQPKFPGGAQSCGHPALPVCPRGLVLLPPPQHCWSFSTKLQV